MNLLFFGPPGAGKGTQSSVLVDKFKIKHISTGNLFRAAMKEETALGLEAKGYVDRGELVPDSITIGMVKEEFHKLEGQGFILDGFPRNIPQAEALRALLQDESIRIDNAIFLEVDSPILLKRLAGRRSCKNCSAIFHVSANPPKKERVCDKCGGDLVQRDDDQEVAIQLRLDLYKKVTDSLKEFYGRDGLLAEVDGYGDVESVYERIRGVLPAN